MEDKSNKNINSKVVVLLKEYSNLTKDELINLLIAKRKKMSKSDEKIDCDDGESCGERCYD